jgi:hypothetical protein
VVLPRRHLPRVEVLNTPTQTKPLPSHNKFAFLAKFGDELAFCKDVGYLNAGDNLLDDDVGIF